MSRSTRLSAISLSIAALLALVALAGCAAKPAEQPAEVPAEQPTEAPVAAPEKGPVVDEATELKIEDVTEGTGDEATAGKTVTVHYTGWLSDGNKFDSSLDSGQPFQFVLGQGMVIAGWDEGVAGMKVGGKRRLIIPPDKGYGEQGAGGVIPPNATLVFDVELLGVN